MYRGSRKHVLDWVEQSRFLPELLALAAPVDCRVTKDSIWQPLGYRRPSESRLEYFGPSAIPGIDWKQLEDWWLVHRRGANTPNWDIALACEVEGKSGLVLVEAKANVPELSEAGKRREDEPSSHSEENHERIRAAIESARVDLGTRLPGISIDVDRHYQLSNRIAFAWKLARLGVPTVLMYVGFLGDTNMDAPFASESEWDRVFVGHLRQICPQSILDAPVEVGPGKFWVLSRTRQILELSPSR